MLHLVGILFPHINDDARSKSYQISIVKFISCNTNTGVSHFLSPPIPYSVLLGCYCF